MTDVRHRRPSTKGIVDCDVHVAVASPGHVTKHLSKNWRQYRELVGGFTHEADFYPRQSAHAARTDAWPPSGLPPGADLEFVRIQLLDAWNVETAILTPYPYPGEQRNPGYAAALARAWNEWQLEEWVNVEPRFRASVFVSPDDPEEAVEEIERRAGDPRFVQVLLTIGTTEPAGKRRYWKMYAAATAAGFPVAFHFSALNGHPTSGAGFLSYYIENHTGAAMMFQDQVASLVFEGAFEAVPDLKIVLVEGGISWLPPLMWRMDRAWAKLGNEVPHLKRPPSCYIRDHIWLTTQPIEEPPTDTDLITQLEYLRMPERIMFSSDYPHWDFDAPDRALPRALPAELRRRILCENAKTLYGLDDA